jgi:hypothetical protein
MASQVTFEDAIATLKAMFGTHDHATLESVLRANSA